MNHLYQRTLFEYFCCMTSNLEWKQSSQVAAFGDDTVSERTAQDWFQRQQPRKSTLIGTPISSGWCEPDADGWSRFTPNFTRTNSIPGYIPLHAISKAIQKKHKGKSLKINDSLDKWYSSTPLNCHRLGINLVLQLCLFLT